MDGEILHDKEEILNGHRKLPPSLSLRPAHGHYEYTLYTNDSAFFLDSVYKIVSF